MTRGYFLAEAERIVTGEREQYYGSPEDNFDVIARLWEAYKGIPFSPVDVAMMMILLKLARIRSGPGTPDSFVDIAGYAACAGEIWAKRGVKDGGMDGNQSGSV